MLPAEWTRMAIAFAVAIVAMSYLAIDAGVVNTSVITRPIKVAQASIIGAAMGQHQLSFAVQRFVPKSTNRNLNIRAADVLTLRFVGSERIDHVAGHEDRSQAVRIDRGVRQQQPAPLSSQHQPVDPVQDEAGGVFALACEQAGSVEILPGDVEGLCA